MDYTIVKHIHMTCAALSIAFFIVRGAWMFLESPKLQARFVKIAPHVVDTFFLASAVTLAVMSAQYPFVQGWLTAKVLALVAYILLGKIALEGGKTKAVRSTAFVAGLLVFGYIGAVAFTKNPLVFL